MNLLKHYKENPNTIFISREKRRYRAIDYDPNDLIYPFTLKNILDKNDVMSVSAEGYYWGERGAFSDKDIIDYDEVLTVAISPKSSAPIDAPFDLKKALAGELVFNQQRECKLWVIGESKFDKNSYIIEYENGEVEAEKLDALMQHCQMWQAPPRIQLDLPRPLKTAKAGERVYKKGSRCIIGFFFNPNNQKHKDFLAKGALFATEQEAQEWLDAMTNARQ